MRRNPLREVAVRALPVIAVVGAVVGAAVAVAGTAEAQGAVGTAHLAVAHSDVYGDYLVDGHGMALYVAVEPGNVQQVNGSGPAPVAACTGACLAVWPPVLTDGAPQAGPGVDAGKVSTVTGPNGGTQVRYAGWPLYTYAADTSQGDTFGQAVVPPQGAALGAAWYLIAPDGSVILKAPPGP